MPQFFIPHASSEEQEQIYEAIAKFVHAPLDGRRIFALSWVHNTRPMSCQVGEPMPPYYETGEEEVAAIFDAGNHYKICTPSRGVIRGEPILAGRNERTHVVYFDV